MGSSQTYRRVMPVVDGFTKSFIYPGLDSVAHDVRMDELRRWGHKRKAFLEELERERSADKRRAKRKWTARKK